MQRSAAQLAIGCVIANASQYALVAANAARQCRQTCGTCRARAPLYAATSGKTLASTDWSSSRIEKLPPPAAPPPAPVELRTKEERALRARGGAR